MYTISYLFLKKRPLSWDQTTYGIFVGIYKFVTASALFTFVPLMKNKFKMHDSMIIILAIISTSVGELLFGLSTHSWMVFLCELNVNFPILSDLKTDALLFPVSDSKLHLQRHVISRQTKSLRVKKDGLFKIINDVYILDFSTISWDSI